MISVVMGLSRLDAYVPLAVDSILAQTFSTFELIIVVNGSAVQDIVDQLTVMYPNEPRLRFLKSSIPQLGYALNLGIDCASFDFIARMDADDIAHPEWLKKQLHALQVKGLDMVGCDLRLIDDAGKTLGTRVYPKGIQIDRKLSFKNCFAHNTVIIRKSCILAARGYNAGFNSEDYDLWFRLQRLGIKWDNTADTLVDYRIHAASTQRHLLGYAEAAGLSMREFLLNKSLRKFAAVIHHTLKALLRAKSDRW
jgi:glycosyltransferase involved in cell wall biosynthesis